MNLLTEMFPITLKNNKSEILTVDNVEHVFPGPGDDTSWLMLMRLMQGLTCALIIGTNGPMIKFIMSQGTKTFLDWLIVYDCFLCLSNIPVLVLLSDVVEHDFCAYHVFFAFFVNLSNKLLTLGIVIYRFTLVIGSSVVVTTHQKTLLENLIMLFILFTSFYLTGWAFYYREDYRHFLGKDKNGKSNRDNDKCVKNK